MRMSPHDPQNAIFNMGLATAHYLAGRYPKRSIIAARLCSNGPDWPRASTSTCASLAQAGQIDEAREALAQLKELHPALSIAWIEQNVPHTSGPMAKFLEGMRKAGLR